MLYILFRTVEVSALGEFNGVGAGQGHRANPASPGPWDSRPLWLRTLASLIDWSRDKLPHWIAVDTRIIDWLIMKTDGRVRF